MLYEVITVPTYMYATLLSGAYDIGAIHCRVVGCFTTTTPAIHCRVRAVFTNTVPVDAYRGAGRPEATFILERLRSKAAVELGLDQARNNFV